MQAIVNVPLCPIMLHPSAQCERADEVLFGMEVELLEEAHQGWWKIRTHYRYEGYANVSSLVVGEHTVSRWRDLPKQVVLKGVCDVQAAPKVQSWAMATLTRGAIVAPEGEVLEDGWQKVTLPDGREGYLKSSFLGEYHSENPHPDEESFRQAVVRTALNYLGTHYRWGGKTPLGIDCSGLVSMAYLLNGVVIWRDAGIREGFPIRPIPREEIKPGDFLFFPGHVALYIGNSEYVHSTGFNGSDGTVINSLDPGHPRYRLDLDKGMTGAGTYF